MSKHNDTIHGSTIITSANYAATHGCDAFRAYVTALDATFMERKASGVYVIRCTKQVMAGIAAFAGFDAVKVLDVPGGAPAWMVRRAAGVTVIDASC